MMAAMSAAVVLLAAGLAIRGGSMEPGISPVPASRPVLVDAVAALDTVEPLADDASFNLLADLASDLDWNDAAEAGLAVRSGASDLALVDFSMAEREELQRLLTEELAGRPL